MSKIVQLALVATLLAGCSVSIAAARPAQTTIKGATPAAKGPWICRLWEKSNNGPWKCRLWEKTL